MWFVGNNKIEFCNWVLCATVMRDCQNILKCEKKNRSNH